MSVQRFIVNTLISGTVGGIVSHLVASLCSRDESGRGELPMHAVSHIWYGDEPESHEGFRPADAAIGTALHHGACFFWATFFEALFGKDAERSTPAALAGGATVAAAAYVTDYHIVSERFKPGFEAYLSDRSLFLVYAGLALGFAAGARLRGLRDHEIEDRDEREESGKAERGPDVVIAPEERR
jgi:hypothetical protein